jgi:hypothetical protein
MDVYLAVFWRAAGRHDPLFIPPILGEGTLNPIIEDPADLGRGRVKKSRGFAY